MSRPALANWTCIPFANSCCVARGPNHPPSPANISGLTPSGPSEGVPETGSRRPARPASVRGKIEFSLVRFTFIQKWVSPFQMLAMATKRTVSSFRSASVKTKGAGSMSRQLSEAHDTESVVPFTAPTGSSSSTNAPTCQPGMTIPAASRRCPHTRARRRCHPGVGPFQS
jgi:hypothetical protein